MNEPNPSEVPPARRFRLLPWWLALVIGLTAGAGAYLLYDTRPDWNDAAITHIRIEKIVSMDNPSAVVQDAVETFKSLGSNPSLFLEVDARGRDEPIRTEPFDDTPIGNGLTFELPEPVEMRQLREIRIRNDGWISDKIVDRVEVDQTVETGQAFTFTLMSPDVLRPMPTARMVGWVLVIAAAGGLGVALLRFVVLQVV